MKGSQWVEERNKHRVKPVDGDGSDTHAYVNFSNATEFHTYQ